jgi:SAM-dependent methyltransferase
MDEPAPHSAAYFNEQRDFWWNADYLQLVARRLRLSDVSSALDVGAGIGHWGRALMAVLAANAHLMSLERDARWVAAARQAAADTQLVDRCEYRQGIAEALPFDDATFDLVTCQTLLIHVADPTVVIAEMRRVLRPGGVVLLSEPNNLAGALVADSVTAGRSLAAVVEHVEFVLTCERGKQALGEGNSSVGDLLPGYLHNAGFRDIQSFLNDKTDQLVPPYERPDERALAQAIITSSEERRWTWTEDDARRYFAAGGGQAEDFDRRWQRRLSEQEELAQQLRDGRLHGSGGGIHYLISGRRASR